MPIDRKQVHVMSKCGQNANKGGNHGNLPQVTSPLAPVTLKFSVENKYTYLNTERPTLTKRWVRGANQNAKRQAKAEQNHEGESAQQWHNYTCP